MMTTYLVSRSNARVQEMHRPLNSVTARVWKGLLIHTFWVNVVVVLRTPLVDSTPSLIPYERLAYRDYFRILVCCRTASFGLPCSDHRTRDTHRTITVSTLLYLPTQYTLCPIWTRLRHAQARLVGHC